MEKGNMKEIWTVSELNDKIKALLESYYGFMWIEGEVSNLRRPASGHRYFTLKDNKSQIRAVVFQSPAGRATGQGTVAGFDLEDGLYVLCRGRLTVYGPRGDYQLIIDRIEPRGLGALQKAYEQLNTRLMAEGLFDPPPFYPGKSGSSPRPQGRSFVTSSRFQAAVSPPYPLSWPRCGFRAWSRQKRSVGPWPI